MAQATVTIMVLAIHKQRFWAPSRIVGLEGKLDPQGDTGFLDLPIGVEVEAVDCRHGKYLCHKDGYYCWIDASWVNAVCAGVVCKCPTNRCPRHGRLGMK